MRAAHVTVAVCADRRSTTRRTLVEIVSVVTTSALIVARPVAAQHRAATAMPVLHRVAFPSGVDTLAWKRVSRIAVSGNGRVALTSDLAMGHYEGFILQIFSPASDTITSLGRRGSGPGELSGLDTPFAAAAAFHIVDVAKSADVRYHDNGTYAGETRMPAPLALPVAFHGDSVDTRALPANPYDAEGGLTRSAIGSSSGRLLLAGADSFAASLDRRRRSQPGVLPGGVYATTDARVAVGDGLTYHIIVAATDGRVLYSVSRRLPPNHRPVAELAGLRKSLESLLVDARGNTAGNRSIRTRLDSLDRESAPYFGPAGLAFDASGRLWVIGESGDSTFADAFDGSTLLGRQMLPCTHPENRIALNGRWLALDCSQPSHVDAPFQIQLYEIPR